MSRGRQEAKRRESTTGAANIDAVAGSAALLARWLEVAKVGETITSKYEVLQSIVFYNYPRKVLAS